MIRMDLMIFLIIPLRTTILLVVKGTKTSTIKVKNINETMVVVKVARVVSVVGVMPEEMLNRGGGGQQPTG